MSRFNRLAVDLTRPFLFVLALVLAMHWAGAARAMGIQRVVSPGGIEVWLVEEHSIPLVAMSFSFRGGASQDPADKTGVGYMVSGLLDEGAGDLDSQSFQKRLQEKSIQLSFSASRDAFDGELRSLVTNLDDATEMMRLAVNEPRFDAEPVERVRAQIISSIKRRSTDPETIAMKEWFKTAFPDHPYGRPTRGTEDTVALITADDLRSFHNSIFARDTVKIAIVGAIDAATAGAMVDKIFGALPATAKLVPVSEVKPVTGATRVEKMAIAQTVIRFGGRGLKRADEDFVPAYVMNHILGGGSFTSRLYTEIREKRGLAYSVYTFLAPFDHSGVFIGGTATRSGKAGETLELIQEEIRRMAKDGPTEEELDKAKKYLTGSYALRFDSSGKIATELVGIQMENLGIDYIEKRNGLIEAVTLEDVKRVAKRLLDQGGMTITVVGEPGA